MMALGTTSLDCRQDGAKLEGGVRAGYLFNTTIAGIEQADACLIIGSNPRREAALINARLRKRYLTGGLKIGVVGPRANLAYELVYLLGADEIDTARLGSAFVIYQGHHGDRGAHRADVILPGAAYTEKPGTYVNTEGRVQRGVPATFPRGDAREDWKILRALAEHLKIKLPYDTLAQLRAHLAQSAPVFAAIDVAQPGQWVAFGTAGPVEPAP